MAEGGTGREHAAGMQGGRMQEEEEGAVLLSSVDICIPGGLFGKGGSLHQAWDN